ncbi:MAG: sirohydrochlorin cobaltochelatase [Desulfobulbaceae bacterium]
MLVMFGTSVPDALPDLMAVRARVAGRFPGIPVRMAFSSGVIRRIWRERSVDQAYRNAHPEVEEAVYEVQGVAGTVAELREEGISDFVLQPVLVAPMETVPSPAILLGEPEVKMRDCRFVVGRPALGAFDSPHSYRSDVEMAARAVRCDVERAFHENCALYYLGHGSGSLLSDRVYGELLAMMEKLHPEVPVVMSLVEGAMTPDHAIGRLREFGVGRVLLKPYMIAAGNHVRREMCGPGSGTLQALLESAGFTVVPVPRGLGENEQFCDIFADNASDAARQAGIRLTNEE